MTRFAESPVPYLLIGVTVVSILLILYVQTRRTSFMAAMLIVALFTVAGVFIEQAVVTDREAIETAIYDTAASVEANDVPGVLIHISMQSANVRNDAQREMSRYEFVLARIITAPQTEFFWETSPPTARVRCRGVVSFKDGQRAALDFTLTFGKEGDRWLLLGYNYNVGR